MSQGYQWFAGVLENKVIIIQILTGICPHKITSTLFVFYSLFGLMSILVFHNHVQMSFTNGKQACVTL